MEKWWGTWERRRNGASSARKQARDERAAVREEVGINVHGWIGKGGGDRQKWGTRKKGTRERGSRPSFAVLAYDAPAAGGALFESSQWWNKTSTGGSNSTPNPDDSPSLFSLHESTPLKLVRSSYGPRNNQPTYPSLLQDACVPRRFSSLLASYVVFRTTRRRRNKGERSTVNRTIDRRVDDSRIFPRRGKQRRIVAEYKSTYGWVGIIRVGGTERPTISENHGFAVSSRRSSKPMRFRDYASVYSETSLHLTDSEASFSRF